MPYDPSDNWSYSSLSCIFRCAHQWYLRYVKRDRRPGPAFFVRGTAVHAAAEGAHKRQMIDRALRDPEFFKRVRQTGIEKPEQMFLDGMEEAPGTEKASEEAKDLAADAFDKEWGSKEIAFDPGDDPKVVREETRATSINMAEYYVGAIAPPLVPEAVEHQVKMSTTLLPDGVTLKGYIDLVTDEDGDEYIRDLKTAQKKPAGDPDGKYPNQDAINSMQLSVYSLMLYADRAKKTGEKKMPAGSKLVHLIETPKSKKRSVVVQETKKDLEDMKILMRRIKTAVKSAKSGIFLPGNQGGFGSPCTFCEYADGTCEYVRKDGVK
jgi:hypothetical protein